MEESCKEWYHKNLLPQRMRSKKNEYLCQACQRTVPRHGGKSKSWKGCTFIMIYLFTGIVFLVTIFFLWAERGLIKNSTIVSFKEHGVKNLRNFLYMYLYARWPDKYIKTARFLLPQAAKKGPEKVSEGYHSKILTPNLAKKIVTINKSIPLKDLEKIIPYPVARKIVLTNPLDIVVLECPCRASAQKPCSPSMVCMIIGKPFTDFIIEHHPDKSKRLTQKEALVLLDEVHKQGSIHTAYFKEACLDRFYVICNCCKCCCLGLEAMVKHGVPIMSPSGYCAQIDKGLCIGCGLCLTKCPFNAISSQYEVIEDKCMGCGVCISTCPKGSISLERNESKGIPLDVEAI